MSRREEVEPSDQHRSAPVKTPGVPPHPDAGSPRLRPRGGRLAPGHLGHRRRRLVLQHGSALLQSFSGREAAGQDLGRNLGLPQETLDPNIFEVLAPLQRFFSPFSSTL